MNVRNTFTIYITVVFLSSSIAIADINDRLIAHYPFFNLNETIKKNKHIIELTNLDSSHNLTTYSVNTQKKKGKEDFDRLLGTWDLSYGGYKSRMEIILSGEDDGGIALVLGGLYFEDNKEKEILVCFSIEDTPMDNKLNFLVYKYLCMTTTGPHYRAFLIFTLGGADKTNVRMMGAWAFGGSTKEAVQAVVKKVIDNETGGSVGGNKRFQAVYDEFTSKLTIPNVIYKENRYNITLKDTGNLIFTTQVDSRGEDLASSSLDTEYDEERNELIIPFVNYRDKKYFVILKNTGDLIFIIDKVIPLPLTEESIKDLAEHRK